MKKILLACSALIATTFLNAQKLESLNEKQVSEMNVTGKWVGKRHQYTDDKKGVLRTFEYEFDLKQEGKVVTGVSSIIGSNGDFGDIKIRGVITGNKLMFEEYEVVNEHHNNPDMVWCFKAGELTFAKEGEQLLLCGATSSFIPYYNFPCSGGYTKIIKADAGNAVDFSGNFNFGNVVENFEVNVFPNPYFDKATVNFNLPKDSKAELRVMDMQGKVVADLHSGKLAKGNHNFVVDAKESGLASGNLIVVLKANGETHSKALFKANY